MARDYKQDKESFFKALDKLLLHQEVDRITINYYGYGDEGNMEAPIVWAKGSELDIGDVRFAKLEDLLSFVDNWFNDHYGGYGNNEGGQGSIIIDCKSKKIRCEHKWNVTSTEEDFREI